MDGVRVKVEGGDAPSGRRVVLKTTNRWPVVRRDFNDIGNRMKEVYVLTLRVSSIRAGSL